MKLATLEVIEPLLEVLRAHPALEETSTAEFDLNGREFIHFHEEADGGVMADVLLVKGRIHMPVSTLAEQGELLDRIDDVLESLERRQQKRRRRSHRRPSPLD